MLQSPVGFEVEQSHSDILELETRNRELAALLAQHVQTNEQLSLQNQQIVSIPNYMICGLSLDIHVVISLDCDFLCSFWPL